jgi:DNA-binding MarR family transcriptional regulator
MTVSIKLKDHEISVLNYLLSEGEVYKSRLISVISSPPILTNVLRELEKDGLIIIKERRIGRKSFLISLTPKGRAVAEQLKKADEIARGDVSQKGLFSDEHLILLWISGKGTEDFASLKGKYGYSAIENLKNLGLIEQEIDNKTYPPGSFVKITGKGKKVAKLLKEIEEVLKE